MNKAGEGEFGRARAAANRLTRFINTNGSTAASEFNGRRQPVWSSADNNRIVVCQETPALLFVGLAPRSQAIGMTATTVRLTPTCRVPAVQAAKLIIRGWRTFARFMSAFFGRLFVVHFPHLYVNRLKLQRGLCVLMIYVHPRSSAAKTAIASRFCKHREKHTGEELIE